MVCLFSNLSLISSVILYLKVARLVVNADVMNSVAMI